MDILDKKISHVLDALESVYHCERDEKILLEKMRNDEPLDGLVLTILSQNTNDKNRDVAFANLKSQWKTWEEVAKITPDMLSEKIRTAGLSAIKSERILFILEKIKNDFGAYSLKGIEKRGLDFVRDYLNALPGIGPKTTACVLLFEFGLPAFPVDTHIARVCTRLGIGESKSPEKIGYFMEKKMHPSRYLGAHVNIIEHGRNVCKARKPKCAECVLKKLCPSRGDH